MIVSWWSVSPWSGNVIRSLILSAESDSVEKDSWDEPADSDGSVDLEESAYLEDSAELEELADSEGLADLEDSAHLAVEVLPAKEDVVAE